MQTGCDYAWERPDPQQLRAEGYTFACRYLSPDTTGKNLTRDEADALHAAGLSIVLNWEYGQSAARNGYSQGYADARVAQQMLADLYIPVNSVVYFSVDFDAQSSDFPAISGYFQGCAEVLGRDRVGVYGGYNVIALLAPSPFCAWFWQTYAWSGGRWHGAAHIRQTQNGVLLGTTRIDLDQAMTVQFGQWAAEGMMMSGNGFSDPSYGDGMAWRVDALTKMLDHVAGGPYAGENMGLVQAVKDIQAQVVSNGAQLSQLMSLVNTLSTVVAALSVPPPATSGVLHVTGDLTVTP